MDNRFSSTPYSYREAVAQSCPVELGSEGFTFKAHFRHSGTPVSDFRSGAIRLCQDGIRIEGKAVPRPPRYVALLLAIGFILTLKLTAFHVFYEMIFGLIYFCLQAGCELMHAHRTLDLTWEDVREIVCLPKKRLICLVYNSGDDGRGKSLTFRQNDAFYGRFIAIANRYGEGKVSDGKLHEETSPLVAVLVVLVTALLMLGAFFWAFGW